MKYCLPAFNVLFSVLLTIVFSHSKSIASGSSKLVFDAPEDFYFGLAGAPAHLEDRLNDIWLEFANAGGVAAYKNIPQASKRLMFWTKPEVELDLVEASGVDVYRMGVDWGRIMPHKPRINEDGTIDLSTLAIDLHALARYRKIVEMANARGLEVIVSLFHHSMPSWMLEQGGWKYKYSGVIFYEFSRVVVSELADVVDSWVTFNEPAVYAALTYAGGIWPPGGPQDAFAFMKAFGVKGSFKRALDNMIQAHKSVYLMIKNLDFKSAHGEVNAKIGIAHNVALYTAGNLIDNVARNIVTYNLVDEFPNRTIGYLDFLGINYYGEEIVTGTTVAIREDREYSESGRTVNPSGLYIIISKLNHRYNVKKKYRKAYHPKGLDNIPFVITENGISDATDILRPAYMIEHLRAVDQLLKDGINILGFIFWTVSDNWEWADGYCPKFGLFAVDRTSPNLQRTPRDSFFLFQHIVKNKRVTMSQADSAWNLVRENIGNLRPFCRGKDGKSSHDLPSYRPIVDYDWRFSLP